MSRSIFSFEAYRKLDRLIRDSRPDIAHLHNIHHHLTPSILFVLRKHHVPVVWTAHDYKLLCPNSNFLSGDAICERCKRRNYHRIIATKCKKDSFRASLVTAAEAYGHWLLRVETSVDRFITPSLFLRDKFIDYGFDPARFSHIPNFIADPSDANQNVPEDYFVFVGRLWTEKGLDVLARAMQKVKTGRLLIVGDGPMRKELQAELAPTGKVEFLGQLSPERVAQVVGKAMFVVLPSKCYENFPYTILEAFALAKPVIGARIGGINEMIDDQENGLLFEMGNSDDLAEKISQLANDRQKARVMGEAGREKVRKNYNPDTYYEKLMAVFEQLIPDKKRLSVPEPVTYSHI